MNRKTISLALALAVGFFCCSLPPAVAQTGSELERSEWVCKCRQLRSNLEESGVTFRGTSTHYAFGIKGGINVPVPAPLGQGDAFKYTGRERYNLTLDLDRLNWAKASTLNIRAENWYGEYGNVGVLSGAFAPPLFPTVLPPSPNDRGIPKLTGFFLTRRISDSLVIFGGIFCFLWWI